MFDKDLKNNKFNQSEFVKRSIVTVIFAPIMLFIMYKGGMYIAGFMLLVSFVIGCEWQNLIEYEKNKIWYLVGALYVFLPCLSMIYLGFYGPKMALITLTLIVLSTDIGGYIVGKIVGGPKLCPGISPNKTLAGFIGGLILAALVGHLIGEHLAGVTLLAMVAQFGDLLESYLKRKFGADKSGNLIPGHGGVMDRFDSFSLASIFLALLHYFG
jgi:phosphatidate cytidylyltransferase